MDMLFVGAKGGVGTSTIVAVTAINLAEQGERVHIVTGEPGDLAAILGTVVPYDLPGELAPNITIGPEKSDDATNLTDAGTTIPDGYVGDVTIVVQNCYLALRRALAMPKANRVVAIIDRERSLTEHDIEDVLGTPVIKVTHDASVSRAVDAGLLAVRLPRILRTELAK